MDRDIFTSNTAKPPLSRYILLSTPIPAISVYQFPFISIWPLMRSAYLNLLDFELGAWLCKWAQRLNEKDKKARKCLIPSIQRAASSSSRLFSGNLQIKAYFPSFYPHGSSWPVNWPHRGIIWTWQSISSFILPSHSPCSYCYIIILQMFKFLEQERCNQPRRTCIKLLPAMVYGHTR